jgi:hypothetical protein
MNVSLTVNCLSYETMRESVRIKMCGQGGLLLYVCSYHHGGAVAEKSLAFREGLTRQLAAHLWRNDMLARTRRIECETHD